jgi:hypothetical protein
MSRGTQRTIRLVGLLAALCVAGSWHYQRSPWGLAEDASRVAGSAALSVVYGHDLEGVRTRVARFYVGDTSSPPASTALPGLTFRPSFNSAAALPRVAFVYEDPDASPLSRLREEYDLSAVGRDAPSEYEAQLTLGRWVGTRFAHREEGFPEGYPNFDPVEVLHHAEEGEAYWCEVAAKLTVDAATSLGWPARLITASRTGSRWDHAVAELWSNEYRKWYVLDTDYNQVFEVDGRPLSAFELCHDGPALSAAGRLRARPFAAEKPGVDRRREELPYFAYVHVDMRNDWLTRRLHKGSPAGGELGTIWTARPEVRCPPTLKKRVDAAKEFDWPVNVVVMRVRGARALEGGRLALDVALGAYAPYFRGFELAVDDGAWQKLTAPIAHVELPGGEHSLRARVVTYGDHEGPVHALALSYRPSI